MMALGNANKAFIQAFLSRNVLTLEQAKPILAAIWSVDEGKDISPDDISQADFTSMISAANKALTPLDYEIRMTTHQDTREAHYALVNTTSDQLTQVATTLSNDEIGYVKRLLDEMFDTNNTPRKEAMCIHGKDALNLVRAGRRDTQSAPGDVGDSTRFNLTMSEGEATLAKLVAEGWLEKSAKGFYSLSPRGLMELKSWLIETYNDEDEGVRKIKECEACKEIITTGQRCATTACEIRLHNACSLTFFRAQRSQACPRCKAEWDGKHFVGEKAITTSESYLRGRRRSGPGQQDPDANTADGDAANGDMAINGND